MNFKKLIKLFLFSKHFKVVFLLFFTQLLILNFTQILIKTKSYNDTDQVKFLLITFLITLIFGAYIKIYSIFIFGDFLKLHSKKSILEFLKPHLINWIVIEARFQVRVILRLFLLIIPGILELLRLSLCIPMVFLDSRMSDPHFDPIKESLNKLPLKSPFLMPLFIFTLIIPLLISLSINSEKIIFESPINILLGIVTALVQSIGIVISYAYIFHIYLLINKKEKTQGDLNA